MATVPLALLSVILMLASPMGTALPVGGPADGPAPAHSGAPEAELLFSSLEKSIDAALERLASENPAGNERAGAARAGSTVLLNGTVNDSQGNIPFVTAIAAVMASDYSIANITYTLTGYYELNVTNSTLYILLVFPISSTQVSGYNVHGHIPTGRYLKVENSSMRQDFTLRQGHDIILEAYDPFGALISEENFTNVKWTVGAGQTAANARTLFAVWTGCSNGSGTNVPSVVVLPDDMREIFVQWTCEGFGKVNIKLDNGSAGFGGPAGGGQVLRLNYELARSQSARTAAKKASYEGEGVIVSQSTLSLINSSAAWLQSAASKTGAEKAKASDACLNASLWALEGLELDRAVKGIEEYRKGNLNISVVDGTGYPVRNATVTVNQTTRDFLYGVFGQYRDVGESLLRQLQAIGLNIFTAGMYWSVVEPNEGTIDRNAIDNIIGVPAVHDMGYQVKAHAPCYLIGLVLPDWLKAKNFTELNKTVYRHVSDLVKAYGDQIEIWEITNEASGTGANMGLPREQMLEIIRTAAKAIRDNKPDARLLINNGFFWFGEQLSSTYLIEPGDDYSMSVPEFLDWLDESGIDIDITGQQMYDGGYTTFFEDAGLGPGGGASTFEFSMLSEILDALGSYGRPVHITEESISSLWNESPQYKDAGWWHSKWNPQTQADFLTTLLTVLLSKPTAESFTWWDMDDRYPFMKGGGLFDANLLPKPIFYAWRDFIANHSTNMGLVSNSSGISSLRAYGGDYNITVRKDGHTANATVHITEQKDANITVKMVGYAVRPDLNITPDDITFDLSERELTGYVTVNATVRNTGDRDAPAFVLRALDYSGTPIDADKNMGPLATDASASASFTWNASNISGVRNITLIADPLGDVEELGRDNNNATLSVDLAPVSWGYLEGFVSENGTGVSVSGVNIILAPYSGPDILLMTGMDGIFRTARLPTGAYNITIDKTDYGVIRSKTIVPPGTTLRLNFSLERITEGTVCGTVRDAGGQPVAGARLVLSGGPPLNITLNASSGPAGQFILERVPAGNLTLSVTYPGLAGASVAVEVLGNRTASVNLTMKFTKGSVKGKVTDSRTGAALVNVSVLLRAFGIGNLTDAAGLFELGSIPAGRCYLTVSREGYVTATVPADIVAGASVQVNISMEPLVPLNGSLRGAVKNQSSGKAVSGATVKLGAAIMTLTDRNGTFLLLNIAPGKYDVTVSASGHRTQKLNATITPGNETALEIKLEKQATGTGGGGAAAIGAIAVVLILVGVAGAWFMFRRGPGKEGPAGNEKNDDVAKGDTPRKDTTKN